MIKIDITRLKREARRRSKRDETRSYMQHLDLVAHQLYGVRHFHEARTRFLRVAQNNLQDSPQLNSQLNQHTTDGLIEPLTVAQYYMRSLQEYYLDM